MALLTKEIKINHQVSMKMDLTRKKFEIQKSSEALSAEKLRQRERKRHFLKKEKLKLRRQNREKFAHVTNRTRTHVHHLARRSNCIYCKRENFKKRRDTNHHLRSYSSSRPLHRREWNRGAIDEYVSK